MDKPIKTADDFLAAVTPHLDRLANPGACSYRTDDNRGCIVALAMTDDEIDRIVDANGNNKSPTQLLDDGLLPKRLHSCVGALRAIQGEFDYGGYTRKDFIASLPALARDVWRRFPVKED